MKRESDPRREEKAEEKARVNPATRRDRPGSDTGDVDRRDPRHPQVPPVQEEPLDPLGPGGIGG